MKLAALDPRIQPVSKLVLGLDHQVDEPALLRQIEQFRQLGGNALDTAFHYEAWRERAIARYLQQPGARAETVLILKAGHSPLCTPADAEHQLEQCLANLGTDYADIFLLHRDNPAVPVGEFVDCLSRLERAGKVKIFGGSNWSPARVDEANAYATREQLSRLAVVSNQFGLARWREPLWPGALASSSPEARAWHEQRQMPLLAYSPLGRGFLARFGEAAVSSTTTSTTAPTDESFFDTRENFARRERARLLAAKRGASLVDVALAYVLCQSFPSFAVVGPRTHEQLQSSLRGAELELSQDELDSLEGQSHERVS